MYQFLPLNTSMEEKYKRYAVLASRSLIEKLPYVRVIQHVMTMDKDNLDSHYDKIEDNRISYVYMCAIDRYILTQLAPPFIEFDECSNQIDSSVGRIHLKNVELNIILDIYKQALGLPGGKIDMRSPDPKNFRSAFCSTLRKLFKDYFDVNAILGDCISASVSTNPTSDSKSEASSLDRPSSSNLDAEKE